jgi:hypothetical protein
MKINHENKCKKCGKEYNVNVNKPGSCDNGAAHQPKY